MKLSNLSLAILVAMGVAACGGSNSGEAPKDPQTPQQPDQPDQPKPQPPADTIVDPTKTGVVGKLDLKTESSVGTTQYIRGEKSKFDRTNNPSEKTAATAILGVTLDKQNPYLTNFAAAKLVSKDGKATVVQYLGNPGEEADKLGHINSIQQQNKHNVDLRNGDLTKVGDLVAAGTVDTQIANVKALLKPYQDELATKGVLQEEHKVAYEHLTAVQADLEALKVRIENGDQVGRLALKSDDATIRWGDKVLTQDVILADGSSAVTPGTTGPAALGLVGINYATQTGKTIQEVGKIQGDEEDSRTSTRVFGRNFNTDGVNGAIVPQNSYQGVDRVVLTGAETNYGAATGAGTALEQAHRAFVAANQKSLGYTLAAKPLKLGKVQYGRVTGNLDPVTLTAQQLKEGGTFYAQANYLNKGDAKAVDYYFYRGVDATTVEEMAKLPKGKELTYYGHALMYGIDNSFHGGVAGQVPNAFGDGGMVGLGNFVVANVNLDSNRVKGAVYNVWQDKASGAMAPDNLVAFDGNIHGNSVLGEAQRVYNKSDKADFRASFFGSDAAELGGSFNSTTWQERYGAKGDVWGGVFGAKTDITVDPLTNQWLGDIPDLTKPNN